jgi:hypothetical protein
VVANGELPGLRATGQPGWRRASPVHGYSYDSKAGTYSYTTLADPGAKPTSGTVEIKGNLWTYNSSFENQGKKTLIRTTNEFTDPKTEIFKVTASEDGGVTWKTMLEGKAQKVGE